MTNAPELEDLVNRYNSLVFCELATLSRKNGKSNVKYLRGARCQISPRVHRARIERFISYNNVIRDQ